MSPDAVVAERWDGMGWREGGGVSVCGTWGGKGGKTI